MLGLYKLVALLLLVTPIASAANTASGQVVNCGPRERLLTRLAELYDETLVNAGITSKGQLLEIVAAPSGTWTLLITVPGGPTCMVDHGDGWRTIEPDPEQRVSDLPSVSHPDLRAEVSH